MSQLTDNNLLITQMNPRSPISEAYRTLRTNIQFSSIDQSMRTLMVTSATPGEGKSTSIVNLAITYAQAEHKVLLIDADLRLPVLHKMLNVSNRHGVTSVLVGLAELTQAVQSTNIAGLDVLPSGSIPPNPAELLGSRRMSELLDAAIEHYDIVLIDSPPVLAVTDAQVMAAKCDGVLLVINQGKVKKDSAKKAKQLLDRVQANIIGAILNNVTRKQQESAYYYYYYGET